MKLTFIGVGSPSSGSDLYHSNIILTAESGRMMLIDCGGDARFALAEHGIGPTGIDAVYISHLHADHIGGLEWLGFSSYFNPARKRPQLFAEKRHLHNLWHHALKGGLACIQDRTLGLDDYFEPRPLKADASFTWEGIGLTMVAMPHVQGNGMRHDSYGLLLDGGQMGGVAFLSTDTQFRQTTIEAMAPQADVIFHDCETTSFRSTVHAHYHDLVTLPASVKRKMWLYHYQAVAGYDPIADGFRGFVAKGQEFRLPEFL